MSKVLGVLIGLVVLLTIVIIARGAKESYEILPAKLPKELSISPLANWRDFKSDKNAFKVNLPLLPQHATENVAGPNNEVRKYDMYVAEKPDGTIFMVNLITYPKAEHVDADTTMKRVVSEMVAANPNNVLKTDRAIKFKGYPGRDFSIENSDITMEVREFVKGETLYMLAYIAKKAGYSQEEFVHFVNSFELQTPTQK